MWWKQLFCNHKFQYLGKWPCTFKFEDGTSVGVPITFLECSKCGKREVLRDALHYYNTEVKNYIILWKKGQIELEFEEEKRDD